MVERVNRFHTAFKSTPARLLFGFDQCNHSDSSLTRYIKTLNETDLETNRDANRKVALEATESLKKYNKQYVDKSSRTPTLYKVDDFVMVRDNRSQVGQNTKLKPLVSTTQ